LDIGHVITGHYLRNVTEAESRFATFIRHADRAGPLRDYCTGLVMPCERKSVEPMAAITAPDRTAAQHQSLLHFVGQSPWSDEKVLAKTGEMVLPAIERHGTIEAWIVDDTGFPSKESTRSALARQYCGQLGKQDLCLVQIYVLVGTRTRCCRRSRGLQRRLF
jgi:SRSO17 transposase